MKPAKFESTTMDEQTFVPNTMRALYYSPNDRQNHDGTTTDQPEPGMIFDTDFPTPMPSPNQYLIKVQTAAFSHDELRLAKLLNPRKSIPQIPLHNFCGTVISTPVEDHWNPSGPKYKVDDIVFGLISYTRDGAAADYVVATEDELAFKPRNISAAEAATIPLPALTAWQALFTYGKLDPTDHTRKSLRVLVTNARNSEVGMQALQLLRSPSLFPHYRPWVCATCDFEEQGLYLRNEFEVDDFIIAPLPLPADWDVATIFRQRKWGPVDIVLDCAGEQMFQQVHAPAIVNETGVVLTAVDSVPAQDGRVEEDVQSDHAQRKGPFSRFVSVRPDGVALGQIAKLVEEHSLHGRVEGITDLVNGADILSSGAAGAGGGRRGGIMVFRVNP
ncbi:NADP-dependent oxidoreductase [Aspergillus clavatus NRRL 1]|uniref:Zinc-binding oxidoreductase, putative n=1 Tax=Aspergillus clavatus (strain ATCC 1007 / CBS 513.65 / DSM 816 / NCTC 3887 / NRRL 1 / QM 1276 / 107) TaxID=344612 RepID=A1CQZ7_ASPCL|nr:zinc-binding oxidoreductase, putative [Aspergillus clavatus NRRL 1]EAW08068.1 zinc-binding oxidoreductase, putative [Aspergillus clavatus NRRL 1]